MRGSLRLLGATALVLFSGTSAYAQSTDIAGVDQPADAEFADIVVTARRVAEDIQKVPLTVQAFDGSTLREKSIVTAQDLQLRTPGLFANGSGTPSNTSYTIRGQGRPLVGIGQAAVITYISDVPLPTPASGQPQYDMASIQVLKGPQGTLFGRNTTGGAILLYPQAPTYMASGYLQLGYGNYNYFGAEGALNLPIVADKVALRISGRVAKRDGFVENLGVGRDFHDLDNYSGRVSLLIEPTDGIRSLTVADFFKQSEAGPAQIFAGFVPGSLLAGLAPFTNPTLTSILQNQQQIGIRKTISPVDPRDSARALGIMNRTDIELGDITLTNIFGYRTIDFSNTSNYDGLPLVDLFGFGAGPVIKAYRADAFDQLSDEVQIKGSAFDNRLKWLLGGFYLDSKPGGENLVRVDAFGSRGVPNATFVREKSKAVFGNVSYAVTDTLSANLGTRYTWDSISVCNAQAVGAGEPYAARDGDCRSGLLPNSNQTNAEFKKPTWTIGLDWQVTSDLFAYVTSRRGYRAGGVNAPVLGVGLKQYQQFRPETITDVELGAKGKWRAGNVRGLFSFALFYAKAKNVQYNVNSLTTSPVSCTPATNFDGDCNPANDPSGTSLTFNAGDTSFRGIEGSMSVIPVQHLTLELAGSYLKPKTDKVTFGSLAPFIVAGGNAIDAIPFRFVPKKTVTASARYEKSLGELGSLVANADYYWSDDIVYGAYTGPSYQVVNLRLDWNNVGGRPLDLSLFMRNVFQEKYTATVGLAAASPGSLSLVYGDPRLFGVQARIRFGQ